MSPGGATTFETVDWSAVEDRRGIASRRTRHFGAAVALLAIAFLYDYVFLPANEPLVGGWDVTALDWLMALSLLVMAFYLLVPLATNPQLTRHYWRQLRTNRLAVASLGYVVAFFLVGLCAPVVVDPANELLADLDPYSYGIAMNQPPLGATIPAHAVTYCVGDVADGLCHGSPIHPLGTTGSGEDLLVEIVRGTRVALQVALISSMLVVPLATVVGTVSAHFGGTLDELLMRYVDLQQVIPPFFVYIVAQSLYGPSLFLMVVVFGLLSWGGTARLLRSETLQNANAEYVLAAKSAGSSDFQIIRRHLVPNASHTVVTAVTLQIPTLILVEATLSFLRMGSPLQDSWGYLIYAAITHQSHPTLLWWADALPIVSLMLTVLAFNCLGDALRDVLDPHVQEVR